MADPSQTVVVNGEPFEAPALCSVDALLGLLGLEGGLRTGASREPEDSQGRSRRRVAVAVNRCVVPRSIYSSTNIQAGDRIEILEAVGGG